MSKELVIEETTLPDSLIYYATVIGSFLTSTLFFAWVCSVTWASIRFFSVVSALVSLTLLTFGIILISIRMYQDAVERRSRRY